VKGFVGERKSSHLKSVLMWHVQNGHVPYWSRGVYKRRKWGNVMRASSHQLWRDEHLCGTETVKMAWSTRQTSMCHDHRPQWPCNGSRKSVSKLIVDSLLCGAHITSSRIRSTRRAYVGLLLRFEIVLVPNEES